MAARSACPSHGSRGCCAAPPSSASKSGSAAAVYIGKVWTRTSLSRVSLPVLETRVQATKRSRPEANAPLFPIHQAGCPTLGFSRVGLDRADRLFRKFYLQLGAPGLDFETWESTSRSGAQAKRPPHRDGLLLLNSATSTAVSGRPRRHPSEPAPSAPAPCARYLPAPVLPAGRSAPSVSADPSRPTCANPATAQAGWSESFP